MAALKNLFILLLSVLLLLATVAAFAQDKDDDDDDDKPANLSAVMKPGQQPAGTRYDCPYEKGFQRAQRIGGYTLRLLPAGKSGNVRCRATLTASNGKVTTVTADWALTVDKISGTDINGDGKPELVLDGYSGGAHCCYSYTIIGLGQTHQVLRTLHSQVPMTFEGQADGSTVIRTGDSVFDYFVVPHSDAVIPQLILRMDGNKLLDVGAQFHKEYDAQIEQARAQLSSQDLEKFHQARLGDRMFGDQTLTVHRVLVIVLNYLYSGREAQAWQALTELWPPSDQARIKSLILERRNRGLLKEVALGDAEAAQHADTGQSRF